MTGGRGLIVIAVLVLAFVLALSRAGAKAIGMTGAGVVMVRVERAE